MRTKTLFNGYLTIKVQQEEHTRNPPEVVVRLCDYHDREQTVYHPAANDKAEAIHAAILKAWQQFPHTRR